MSKELFAKGMALLTAAFPSWKMDPALYYEALKDLSAEDFLAAVNRIVKTHENIYAGTNLIAVIRNKAIEGYFPDSGTAWREAYDVANKIRAGYSHPLIQQVARNIGSYELRTSDNIQSTRAHFIKFYEDAIRAEKEKTLREITAGSQLKLNEGGSNG